MNSLTQKSIPISTSRTRNPFNAMLHAWDKTIEDLYGLLESPRFSTKSWEELNIIPSADIVEDKNTFKIEAEMPGMGPEDIKLSISDGILTIKGEKKISKKDKGKNYLIREIGYGIYQRTIPLPDSVDISEAKASFRKGMLWVTLPKKEESVQRSREIEVEAS